MVLWVLHLDRFQNLPKSEIRDWDKKGLLFPLKEGRRDAVDGGRE